MNIGTQELGDSEGGTNSLRLTIVSFNTNSAAEILSLQFVNYSK
jgi:hypothetical protein